MQNTINIKKFYELKIHTVVHSLSVVSEIIEYFFLKNKKYSIISGMTD